MGTNDLFADYALPLSLDQRAMAILNDMGDALPTDGGDALDSLFDELIDEGRDFKEILRVLLTDPIEAGRLLKSKAARFAYAQAREQMA